MVEVVWSEPALSDLDAIADYIALDNPAAAFLLVRRVVEHVDQQVAHPRSGSKLPELKGRRYRQIIEPPCRVIYRHEKGAVLILHVVRSERLFTRSVLGARSKAKKR